MIDDLERAERLARALLADVMLYGAGDCTVAIEQARVMFEGRVAASARHVFERVLSEPSVATFQVRAPAWGGDLVVPKQFAAVTELGAAVKVWGSKENVMLSSAIVTLAGAVCAVIAVAVALTSALAHAMGPLLGGGLLLSLGIYNLLRLRAGASAVVVYEAGFAARVGASVAVWPWREITSIVSNERFVSGGRRRAGYPVRRYAVWKSDTSVVLDDDHLEDARALAERIKERTAALLLPPLQERYDAGQTLTFGRVTVSREGIGGEGLRNLGWSEVRSVVVKDGRLIVTPKDGSPLKVRVSQIPNIELLGMLIGVAPSSMDLVYL